MTSRTRFPRVISIDSAHSRNAIGHSDMRAANMSLIMRRLYEKGAMSRAALVAELGISKASVSSLVAELTERGLVREGAVEREGRVGRPGTEVSIDERNVCGIGLEINVEYTALAVMDLSGSIRYLSSRPLPSPIPPVSDVLDRITAQVREALAYAAGAGMWPAGVTIAPPGVIDYEDGTVRVAANLGWRDVALVSELRERLGNTELDIQLENDAKLAAVAAYAQLADSTVHDLVYLTGDVGVAAGIIAGGALLRGWLGSSGELGHVQTVPDGATCHCGRRGCWELYVGLNAIQGHLRADHPIKDHSRAVGERLALLREAFDRGDEDIVHAVESMCTHLSGGVSLLADVLNPRVLVLGGYYAYFADVLAPRIRAHLEERRIAEAPAMEVMPSQQGLEAAAIGGALAVIDRVLDEPLLVPGGAVSSAN